MGEYHIIVTDSQYARCVWTDGRGGDLDLYFAQADLEDLGVVENPWQVSRVPGIALSVPAVARGADLPVSFNLRKAGPARLRVCDALGREIARKDMGVRAPGTYRELLSGLPNGQTLFIQLVTTQETVSRKTALLR